MTHCYKVEPLLTEINRKFGLKKLYCLNFNHSKEIKIDQSRLLGYKVH